MTISHILPSTFSLALGLMLVTPAAGQQAQSLDDFSDVEATLEAEEGGSENATPDAQETPQPDQQQGEEQAQTPSEATLNRIAAIIGTIDGEAKRTANNWELTIGEVQLVVVTDVAAERMRIITPIAETKGLTEDMLLRLMQANFDSALDARYAIANGLIWSTFIHPLPSLTDRDFASGLLQTKSLADSFGTTFSSGALTYGGGDSSAIIEDQLEELLKELEKQDAI